uniref:Protein translocase TatA n=1 Tax=Mastocarpus papillatus TaxID=31436 RepID=A0A342RZ61_9FLOR|nr:protein translocase TatA [Mastocarpus papillatus]AOL58007.1 protein translocase TatA [Mastocarpus papillatus]
MRISIFQLILIIALFLILFSIKFKNLPGYLKSIYPFLKQKEKNSPKNKNC